jgi:MFS family permease
LPGLPLVLLVGSMFVVGLFNAPFGAARRALFRDVFPDQDLYSRATAVVSSTFQVALLVGFGAGGVAVAALGTRGALLADAATFALSTIVVVAGVRARPRPTGDKRGWWPDLAAGARLVFGDRQLRVLMVLAWLATLYIVPDALATPYAASQHAGSRGVGVLLCAIPVGTIAGNLIVGNRRVSEQTRRKTMIPLAAATGLPLLACITEPGLVVCWLLWAASGCLSAYQVPAASAFGTAIPNEHNGQAWGLLNGTQLIGQGLGLLAAGALAEYLSPLTVVALAGAAGTAVATALWMLARTATNRLRPAS